MKLRHMLILAALMSVFAGETQGRPPQSRELIGTVAAIDRKARLLVLAPVKDPKQRELIWTWQTQFAKDGQTTTSRALVEGTKVKLRYRSPIFGNPFATKINWESERKE